MTFKKGNSFGVKSPMKLYEALEKEYNCVKVGTNHSGRINIPKCLIGKRVRLILVTK